MSLAEAASSRNRLHRRHEPSVLLLQAGWTQELGEAGGGQPQPCGSFSKPISFQENRTGESMNLFLEQRIFSPPLFPSFELDEVGVGHV